MIINSSINATIKRCTGVSPKKCPSLAFGSFTCNTSSCSSWEPYTTSKTWALTGGDGIKAVYVRFKDGLGNTNATPFFDSIVLDTISATHWLPIAAGDYHAMALKTDGTLWAWGYNYYGQLGDGTTTNRKVPTEISTVTEPIVNSGFETGKAP